MVFEWAGLSFVFPTSWSGGWLVDELELAVGGSLVGCLGTSGRSRVVAVAVAVVAVGGSSGGTATKPCTGGGAPRLFGSEPSSEA